MFRILYFVNKTPPARFQLRKLISDLLIVRLQQDANVHLGVPGWMGIWGMDEEAGGEGRGVVPSGGKA